MKPKRFRKDPPVFHQLDAQRALTLLERFEQIERQNRFIYRLLTLHGSLPGVGVPGTDPFLEKPAGRALKRWAEDALATAAALKKLPPQGPQVDTIAERLKKIPV